MRVLRDYGSGSKAGLQQLLASSGLISQLYGTVAQGVEQCLALPQAEAAAGDEASAAARAVEVVGGVMSEFRFIGSDLSAAGPLPASAGPHAAGELLRLLAPWQCCGS